MPFITKDPDRKKLDVGGIDQQETIRDVFGWKISMLEEDDPRVVYGLLATNTAPFNDPNHPGDAPRRVRFVRCKPQQGFMKIEEHLEAPRRADVPLFPISMRPDNEDNFYFAQMNFGGDDWRLYNADPISGLSQAERIEHGDAVRVTFGGTQPISFVLRGRIAV
jgi:hypothetical protein